MSKRPTTDERPISPKVYIRWTNVAIDHKTYTIPLPRCLTGVRCGHTTQDDAQMWIDRIVWHRLNNG